MKRIFKILSFIGFLITSVIFGILFVGDRCIPDEIHLVEKEKTSFSDIFSINITGENIIKTSTDARAVSAVANGGNNYNVNFTLLNTIPIKSSSVKVSKRQYVVLGGEIFGIKLYTEGVMIVGVDSIKNGNKTENPAVEAGLRVGDIILSVNNKKVNSTSEIVAIFKNNTDSELDLVVSQNGKPKETKLKLAYSDADKCYKAGMWLRDSTAGVGTVSFYDKGSHMFASLGHAVCDVDTGLVMPLSSGTAEQARINGCYKGSDEAAGELCGVFTGNTLGSLYENCECGIYGKIENLPDSSEIPVATKREVKVGQAQLLSTVNNDGKKYYDVEIVKISNNSAKDSKNMIVKITDSKLLTETGGIVQGMSGSPIVQNGMLVGVVTHVFLGDSTQGYAIFAENMLNELQTVKNKITDKAS